MEGRDWLVISRGTAPLVVSIPHSGTDLPPAIEARLASPWIARKDTDWWVDRLYECAAGLGATMLRTQLSRTVIDLNRDPTGAPLYPGQITTALCPATTFDGEPLYRDGQEPDAGESAERRQHYFEPYHAALDAELARLRTMQANVVLYDAHSIPSRVPHLFDGELPHLNIGTNSGRSCAPRLTARIEAVCNGSDYTYVTNGRFKGGYITRHHGRPERGVHAVQMELACSGYLREPGPPLNAGNWPVPYDAARAAPLRAVLQDILVACIEFARDDGED